jgi:hypothetical protein
MIDITTIQTFRVPPSIRALQDANNTLKLANDTLSDKNEMLKKFLTVTFIGVGLFLLVTLLKKSNKKEKKL